MGSRSAIISMLLLLLLTLRLLLYFNITNSNIEEKRIILKIKESGKQNRFVGPVLFSLVTKIFEAL